MSNDLQVMITLSALAYTDETPLAGEALADQESAFSTPSIQIRPLG
jgi:hypothetical protein